MTWDPTAQQTAEADTLLMPDLTSVATLNAAGGLLLNAAHQDQASAASGYTFAAGKFTPSIKPGTGKFFWFPADVLTGDQFNLLFWARHPTLNWNAVTNKTLFEINTPTLRLPLAFDGVPGLAMNWTILPGLATPQDSRSVTVPSSSLNIAAGTWAAVELDKTAAGALRIRINGTDVGGATGFNVPFRVTGPVDDRAGGLRFGGTDSGASGFEVSDIKISRTARTVGQTPTLKSLTGTLSIDATAVAGTVPADFLGYVHAFPEPVVISQADAQAVGSVMRTDKLINVTPIKAGGTDGTHPTPGASGLYSYDWQVVDRSMAVLSDRGLKAWISVDSSPQLLGGSSPPFSGSQLTSGYAWSGGYNYDPPNDATAWAHIAGDLVAHIRTLPVQVAFWSVWNEPDLSWTGTRAQFMTHYAATANAIRAVDSTTPIIGAEFSDTLANVLAWASDLVAKHVATGCPLDGVTLHEYTGDIRSYTEARATLNAIESANGLTPGAIPIYWGEFNWSNRKLHPGSGSSDPLEDYQHIRAFGASYDIATLLNALEDGGLGGIAFYPFSQGDSGGWVNAQLYGPNGEQRANYNALAALKTVLGDRRLSLTYDLPPGVYAYAGKNTATGRIGLVFANHGWANHASRDVAVTITGAAGSRRIRTWLVDPTHSSRYDAGDSANVPLYQVSDTHSSASSLSVTVPKSGSVFVALDADSAGVLKAARTGAHP